MADVKWIKIVTDIFDDEKILLIESMPSPDSVIVIWFKLLCFAGKQNNSGVIMLNARIAYTDEMLATIFRRDVNTVRMALKVFEQFDMIRIVDGVITIPNWGKHQSLDQLENKKEYMRNYMREYRERQRLLTAGEAAEETPGEPAEDPSGKSDCKTNSKANVRKADKEGDKDNRKDKRGKKKEEEDTLTLFNRLIPDYTLSGILREKLREWMTYKTERKEPYKETGLKSLLRQVENNAKKHGEPAVYDLIDECMANNWKGLIFDRLKQKNVQAQPIPRPPSGGKKSKAEEMNDYYNMAAGWAAESE